MTVKAIDTIYKGYKFRSRLEARWAVYMDLCDIKWEYEPEGYELPSGRYLPDFYVPAYKSYLEVKPASFEIDPKSREIRLLEELAEGSLRGAVLVAGDPHEFKKFNVWPDPYSEVEDGVRETLRKNGDAYTQYECLSTMAWVFKKLVGSYCPDDFDAEGFVDFDGYNEAARAFLTGHGFEDVGDGSMMKKSWGDVLFVSNWHPFEFFGEPREVMTKMLEARSSSPRGLWVKLNMNRDTLGLKARQARFEHGQSGAA